jgi:uncharacterized protein YecE (DUF72 family)
MAALRIGTCSWKFDSWVGLVYSEKDRAGYLREYARRYDTVEVDQWFWSLFGRDKIALPEPAVVREYAESVPASFRFSVKVPNSITLTHFYKKAGSDALVGNPHFLSVDLFNKFLTALEPMGRRLGPLMFQFEYLNKRKMASQADFLEQFSDFIGACPRGYRYCVETRNPNYLNRTYFDFLRRHRLCHVFLQGYYMPPVFEVYREFGGGIRGLTVIRLHGPSRIDIEARTGKKWDSIVEPRDKELDSLKEMLYDLRERKVTTYLNVNNHYEGSAPLTIERIESRLLGRG